LTIIYTSLKWYIETSREVRLMTTQTDNKAKLAKSGKRILRTAESIIRKLGDTTANNQSSKLE
jgi:hypothetical protein